jgi:hypothetical protein
MRDDDTKSITFEKKEYKKKQYEQFSMLKEQEQDLMNPKNPIIIKY